MGKFKFVVFTSLMTFSYLYKLYAQDPCAIDHREWLKSNAAPGFTVCYTCLNRLPLNINLDSDDKVAQAAEDYRLERPPFISTTKCVLEHVFDLPHLYKTIYERVPALRKIETVMLYVAVKMPQIIGYAESELQVFADNIISALPEDLYGLEPNDFFRQCIAENISALRHGISLREFAQTSRNSTETVWLFRKGPFYKSMLTVIWCIDHWKVINPLRDYRNIYYKDENSEDTLIANIIMTINQTEEARQSSHPIQVFQLSDDIENWEPSVNPPEPDEAPVLDIDAQAQHDLPDLNLLTTEEELQNNGADPALNETIENWDDEQTQVLNLGNIVRKRRFTGSTNNNNENPAPIANWKDIGFDGVIFDASDDESKPTTTSDKNPKNER